MNFEEISLSHFKELHVKGYSLDLVFLLMQVKNDLEIITDSVKINALLSTLERKGLITAENKITIDGQQLLDFINASDGPVKIVKKKVDDEFERWWKCFPSTNQFQYKGIVFKGDRALRVNKDKCKLKLKDILNEGEFTIDQIITATEYNVKAKMESSLKARENKLTYLHNSLTYLNQRDYEAFIDLLSQGNTIQESNEINNGTDI